MAASDQDEGEFAVSWTDIKNIVYISVILILFILRYSVIVLYHGILFQNDEPRPKKLRMSTRIRNAPKSAVNTEVSSPKKLRERRQGTSSRNIKPVEENESCNGEEVCK